MGTKLVLWSAAGVLAGGLALLALGGPDPLDAPPAELAGTRDGGPRGPGGESRAEPAEVRAGAGESRPAEREALDVRELEPAGPRLRVHDAGTGEPLAGGQLQFGAEGDGGSEPCSPARTGERPCRSRRPRVG